MSASDPAATLAHGDRPLRGQDRGPTADELMILVPRIFLEDVLDTLNRVPNLRLNNERWRSTYGMAAALTDFLTRTVTPRPPRTAETDPRQGDG
jgi:hypothetical protein